MILNKAEKLHQDHQCLRKAFPKKCNLVTPINLLNTKKDQRYSGVV